MLRIAWIWIEGWEKQKKILILSSISKLANKLVEIRNKKIDVFQCEITRVKPLNTDKEFKHQLQASKNQRSAVKMLGGYANWKNTDELCSWYAVHWMMWNWWNPRSLDRREFSQAWPVEFLIMCFVMWAEDIMQAVCIGGLRSPV